MAGLEEAPQKLHSEITFTIKILILISISNRLVSSAIKDKFDEW